MIPAGGSYKDIIVSDDDLRTQAHGSKQGSTDLSIDPSDRHVQANPEQANYVRGGRAQIMTPRGFLSTWSGFSSRMVTDDNLAKVTVPTLMVVGTADSTGIS